MKKQYRIVNDSTELFTETFGEADATPVVLIAGAMAPAIFWPEPFCNALAAHGYFVIRFDNRDIGRSTHYPQSAPDSGVECPYTIEDMVEDTRRVLRTHSDKKAHIVGHSLGGSIAQLFAVRFPMFTQTLTAISSPILARGTIDYQTTDPAITDELWRVLMANPMYQDFELGGPAFLKVWRYLNGDWDLDEHMANEYTKSIYATETIGPAWNHTNVQEGIRDIMPELMPINKPVFLIHGSKDYLPGNPENTAMLAEYLPDASLYILPGAGHMFFNQKIWEIFLEKLLNHFKSNDGLMEKRSYV
jgi:pimeloyl-ACP methyl ester carboxylesterase